MRIVRSLRLASLLALAAPVALTVAACDHVERTNVDPARELWATAGDAIRTRTTELRTRQQALAGRIGALEVPDGTEDARLAATITELQGQVGALDQACTAVEGSLRQVTADVEFALSKPNKIAAKQVVDTGLASFGAAADEAKRALDAVTPQVATAEALVQRLLDGIAAEVKRLGDLATSGGTADFSDIDFKVGTAELDFSHPASKATLERLVNFARACDQLRFNLTGHTSREGAPAVNKALSLARAEAVKGYLVSAGIDAVKIGKTDGLGSAQTMVDEPEPGSPAEAAMAPDELDNRRRKNRRVTVQVTAPCTTPVATPPTAPPPPAADAIPPGAPRGNLPPAVERTGNAQPTNPARPVRGTNP